MKITYNEKAKTENSVGVMEASDSGEFRKHLQATSAAATEVRTDRWVVHARGSQRDEKGLSGSQNLICPYGNRLCRQVR